MAWHNRESVWHRDDTRALWLRTSVGINEVKEIMKLIFKNTDIGRKLNVFWKGMDNYKQIRECF